MSGYGNLNDGPRRNSETGKKITFGVLLGVVVLAIVGTVAVTGSKKKGGEYWGSESNVTPKMQLINTICSPTDYKDTCTNFLSNAVNSSAQPKDVVHAAINVTIGEMTKALNSATSVAADGTHENMTQQALDNCKELLQYAVDELRDALSDVSNKEAKDLGDGSYDIKNWLSAVISYQSTCLDGFNDSSTKQTMVNATQTASQLTSNALAIVTELSALLSTLHISGTESRRRLLSDEETPVNGYPEWMAAADRKLLAAGNPIARVTPSAVVAKDGTGQFNTIMAAINAMSKTYVGRYVIYVKAGIYREQVTLDKTKVNVLMYGDGARRSIVTGNANFVDGTQTFKTATFVAIGDGFIAHSMGFQNTAGAIKHQAVALRIQSDRSAFFNCRMDGYQDTLYTQAHRQFFRNCVVSGTIDFIFGDAAALFQNCLIIVRKPLDNQQNTVTAHGRVDSRETTGLVIQNCRIVPDSQLFPVRLNVLNYLGRPWKEYSRTVVMESTIGDLIQPSGWMPWAGDFALNTLYYAEYNNRGPGAGTAGRVRWPGFHVIDRNAAQQFTVGPFLQGQEWISATGAPVFLGLKF